MKFELPLLDFALLLKLGLVEKTFLELFHEQRPTQKFTMLDVLSWPFLSPLCALSLIFKEGTMPEPLQRLCAIAIVRDTPVRAQMSAYEKDWFEGWGKRMPEKYKDELRSKKKLIDLMPLEGIKALDTAERFVRGEATADEMYWAGIGASEAMCEGPNCASCALNAAISTCAVPDSFGYPESGHLWEAARFSEMAFIEWQKPKSEYGEQGDQFLERWATAGKVRKAQVQIAIRTIEKYT